MKVFRVLSQNIFFMILLTSLLLFVSCKQDSLKGSINFSGKELMRGIFFGDGKVVQTIPTIKQNFAIADFASDDETLKFMREAQELLFSELELQDPNTFVDFKNKIGTGNPIIIREALDDYSQRIFRVSKKIIGNSVFSKLLEDRKPLTKFISSSLDKSFDSKEMKLAIKSPSFKTDVDIFFKSYERNLGGRENLTEEKLCAVGPVAAVVAVILYVVAILEAVFFWTDIKVGWSDGIVTAIQRSETNLLYEELINDIALNLHN